VTDNPVGRALVGLSGVVSLEGVVGVVARLVVRVAGVGEVCALVQPVSISTLAQAKRCCFMTIEASQCRASTTTDTTQTSTAGRPSVPLLSDDRLHEEVDRG
jgi:hypothetical protein